MKIGVWNVAGGLIFLVPGSQAGALGGIGSSAARPVTTTLLPQDDEAPATLVERWCEDRQIPERFGIADALLEQDGFVEQVLLEHDQRIMPIKAKFDEHSSEYHAEKAALREELKSDLEEWHDDEREDGDPREIMDSIGRMILALDDEGGGPVVLNPLEMSKKRRGKRTVTVSGKKEKIETVVFGGHEYAQVPGVRNWLDASQWCEDRGGYLACIETREELAFLGRELIGLGEPASPRLDAMQPHRLNYWVGARDSRKEGSWSWLSGNPVDMSLFHQNGIPAQPSEFAWGEHHGGLVIYKHPEREAVEAGLISWNLASNSRGICEWGRAPLPAPWDALSEDEVDELLVPYWKALGKLESEHRSASEKIRTGAKYKRMVEATRRSFSERREDLGKQLEKLRRDSVRESSPLHTAYLKDLAGGLNLGGLDCDTQPPWREGSGGGRPVVGRAFGKSYLIVSEPFTFHDAEDVCLELGGHLPEPRSMLEIDLLRYIMELEGSTSETWLAVSHHPSGSRSGWRGPGGVLGEDSPRWMKSRLEEGKTQGLSSLYAFALVLPLKGSAEGAGEDERPPDPYLLNTQLRRPFICVIEGDRKE